jgi:hypothetical protein
MADVLCDANDSDGSTNNSGMSEFNISSLEGDNYLVTESSSTQKSIMNPPNESSGSVLSNGSNPHVAGNVSDAAILNDHSESIGSSSTASLKPFRCETNINLSSIPSPPTPENNISSSDGFIGKAAPTTPVVSTLKMATQVDGEAVINAKTDSLDVAPETNSLESSNDLLKKQSSLTGLNDDLHLSKGTSQNATSAFGTLIGRAEPSVLNLDGNFTFSQPVVRPQQLPDNQLTTDGSNTSSQASIGPESISDPPPRLPPPIGRLDPVPVGSLNSRALPPIRFQLLKFSGPMGAAASYTLGKSTSVVGTPPV